METTPACACSCGSSPSAKSGKPKFHEVLGALAAAVAWWLIYRNLETFAKWFTYRLLSMRPGSHLAAAVEFLVFEAPKVLMLLTLVVFGVGIVRSFFTPERTRKLLAGRRESVGNVLAALLGKCFQLETPDPGA